MGSIVVVASAPGLRIVALGVQMTTDGVQRMTYLDDKQE